jgi:hypothetical protein
MANGRLELQLVQIDDAARMGFQRPSSGSLLFRGQFPAFSARSIFLGHGGIPSALFEASPLLSVTLLHELIMDVGQACGQDSDMAETG